MGGLSGPAHGELGLVALLFTHELLAQKVIAG